MKRTNFESDIATSFSVVCYYEALGYGVYRIKGNCHISKTIIFIFKVIEVNLSHKERKRK